MTENQNKTNTTTIGEYAKRIREGDNHSSGRRREDSGTGRRDGMRDRRDGAGGGDSDRRRPFGSSPRFPRDGAGGGDSDRRRPFGSSPRFPRDGAGGGDSDRRRPFGSSPRFPRDGAGGGDSDRRRPFGSSPRFPRDGAGGGDSDRRRPFGSSPRFPRDGAGGGDSDRRRPFGSSPRFPRDGAGGGDSDRRRPFGSGPRFPRDGAGGGDSDRRRPFGSSPRFPRDGAGGGDSDRRRPFGSSPRFPRDGAGGGDSDRRRPFGSSPRFPRDGAGGGDSDRRRPFGSSPRFPRDGAGGASRDDIIVRSGQRRGGLQNRNYEQNSSFRDRNVEPRDQESRWTSATPQDGIRISKKLADLGLCSRRDAEKLVTDGKIKINDNVITDLSYIVRKEDKIHLEDKEIPNIQPQTKVFLFNKPVGCLTTNKDPKGRKTVFDLIPSKFGRLITIGRLDYNSEGLLLLTNSGDFARSMELPSSNIQRRYKVLVRGKVDMDQMMSLKDGVTIDDFYYRGISVRLEKEEESDLYDQIDLHKNAEEEELDQTISNNPEHLEGEGDAEDLEGEGDAEDLEGEGDAEDLEGEGDAEDLELEGDEAQSIDPDPETSEQKIKEGINSPEQTKKTWLSIYLNEGKNREIRKIMSHCNLSVIKLIRVGYGKFSLAGIPVGCVMEYKGKL